MRLAVPTGEHSFGRWDCRCADGVQSHESTVLIYSDGGRNRTLMLAVDEVAAVARYCKRQAFVEQAGNAGLEALLSRQGKARRDR